MHIINLKKDTIQKKYFYNKSTHLVIDIDLR